MAVIFNRQLNFSLFVPTNSREMIINQHPKQINKQEGKNTGHKNK